MVYNIYTHSLNVLINYLSNDVFIHLEYILRIVIAGFISIIIGIERRNRNKSAGIRTHFIVGFAAALIMVVSKYGFEDVVEADRARVAAQVVSGIGFLGAGMIFLKNSLVKNLTTAAGVWATAAIGLAFGSGLYLVGLCSALFVFVMQYGLHRLKFFRDIPSEGEIVVIIQDNEEINDIKYFLHSRNIDIEETKIKRLNSDELEVYFHLVFISESMRDLAIHEFTQFDNVVEIRYS